jgi:hypothetical protein
VAGACAADLNQNLSRARLGNRNLAELGWFLPFYELKCLQSYLL